MKVLVVSDSHGRCHYLEKAILRCSPMDYLIHLGDLEGDEEYIRDIAPCPVTMVAGNNDFFSRENREIVLPLGQNRIFITHGHRYHVYSGTELLKQNARERGCNIAMFGHTHVPLIDQKDDIVVINPGSISLPRQTGRKPSYIIMEIDETGKTEFTIQYFE